MKAKFYTIASVILLLFLCLYILEKLTNKKNVVIKKTANAPADG